MRDPESRGNSIIIHQTEKVNLQILQNSISHQGEFKMVASHKWEQKAPKDYVCQHNSTCTGLLKGNHLPAELIRGTISRIETFDHTNVEE